MPHQDILIDVSESEWAGIFAARTNGRIVFARLSKDGDSNVRVPNGVTDAKEIIDGFFLSFPAHSSPPQAAQMVIAGERDSAGFGYRVLRVPG